MVMAFARQTADVLFHSTRIPAEKSGVLVSVSREQAGWEKINFSVRRLLAGQYWQGETAGEGVAAAAASR
jgi:5-deoxy-D-glucuronate isomerase